MRLEINDKSTIRVISFLIEESSRIVCNRRVNEINNSYGGGVIENVDKIKLKLIVKLNLSEKLLRNSL